MTNTCKAILLLCGLTLSILSNAQSNPCSNRNVKIGFFNGVTTSPQQAWMARDNLENIYGKDKNDNVIVPVEVYYNTSQGFTDFVETFDQRLKEQDAVFQDKFYYLFFESLKGGGDFSETIKTAVPAFGGFVEAMYKYVNAKIVASIGQAAAVVGNLDKIEENTFQVHVRQMDAAMAANESMVLVAHSQGNLFANRAYEYFKKKAYSDKVKVVHIAPASATVNGSHTLASEDYVINGLRLTLTDVPEATTFILDFQYRPPGLNNKRDILGHGLLEIYLNKYLPTRSRIDGHVREAIAGLRGPDVGTSDRVILCDNFDGTAVDFRKWRLFYGSPFSTLSVKSGVLEMGDAALALPSPVVGKKIVVEARIKAPNPDRAVTVRLTDVEGDYEAWFNSGGGRSGADYIEFSDSDFFHEGTAEFSGTAWARYAPNHPPTSFDNLNEYITGQVYRVGSYEWQVYRMIIDGDTVTFHRGTSLTNLTETKNMRTMKSSIVGRQFNFSTGAGSGSPPGSRVYVDWMRVSVVD